MAAGAVDVIDNFGIGGWACTDDGARACRVRIDVDGIPTHVLIPSEYRQDLAEAGWARGYCYFRESFRSPIAVFAPASVAVWNDETGALISKPGLVLEPAIRNCGKYAFEDPIDHRGACPTGVTYDGETCITHGLAVYPSINELHAELITGDAAIESFGQKDLTSPAIARTGLTVNEFTMVTRSRGSKPFSLFRVAPIGQRFARTAFAGFVAVPANPPAEFDTPPQANMIRTAGSGVSREGFVATGLTTAAKLNGVAEVFAGRPLSAFKTVLDWGAGSGRVARPLSKFFAPQEGGVEFWCADVDQINVEWAQESRFVGNARWHLIPFYPPTQLPADYFEFIYGISVFTHLTEAALEVWLAELQRIACKGALLVMSAGTEFAATVAQNSPSLYMGDLLRFGISDRQIDGNLGPQLGRGNYYRSTYYLTGYLREVCNRYFEVLDIVHSADVYDTDFVVMRKRAEGVRWRTVGEDQI